MVTLQAFANFIKMSALRSQSVLLVVLDGENGKKKLS